MLFRLIRHLHKAMRKEGEQKGWGWMDREGEIARVVEQMAGNGEVGDIKRTDERDGQGKQSCEKHQYKKKNKRTGRGEGEGGLERFGVKRMARNCVEATET